MAASAIECAMYIVQGACAMYIEQGACAMYNAMYRVQFEGWKLHCNLLRNIIQNMCSAVKLKCAVQ